MDRIVGIVPAGGKARRVHGFFKEMMPIGIDENDKSKFMISSEQIISSMFTGGATSVHFILSSQKVFVGEYYAREHLFDGRVNFNYLTETFEDLGMPFTIDSVYEQAKAFEVVMMGMPDTVVEPLNSFSTLRDVLYKEKADLALGLYRTDSRNRGGFVQIDPQSKAVRSHVDKTSPNFPENADNSWAIACWTRRFTEYMHDFIVIKRKALKGNATNSPKELLFGDVIDAAVASKTIHVVGDFIDAQDGFYWDITEPEKYFDLLRHYSPGEDSPALRPRASSEEAIVAAEPQNKRRVFIGHGRSKSWQQLRDFLRDRMQLDWDEFNRVPVPGVSTQERLGEMLDSVGIAFLVMTAEEERADGVVAARDNVIHEIGLFQGKLGFKKAIILLEEGCAEFSNIVGLSQIRFPKDDLMAKSEEIRRVLEREGLINLPKTL